MKKWNVGWGPVSLCNMNCQFCYSRHRRTGSADLKLPDWISFVDGNRARIASINYGTGENTLDPDWFRLVDHVRTRYPGIRQALTTNGYLSVAVASSEEAMSAFVHGIDEVDVSLDFCDRERHNRFRGQPKAYDWAMSTLKLCRDTGKSTTIVFIGSALNLQPENIDGIFAVAKEFGAIVRMNLFRPTQGLDRRSRKFVAGYDSIVAALKHISARYGVLALNDALYAARLAGVAAEDPSGNRSIRILADGSITPSTYLIDDRYIVANIKEPKVLATLEGRADFAGIMHRQIPLECRKCAYCDECGGGVCDRRYLWYGTLSRRDPHCPGPAASVSAPAIALSGRSFTSVHDGYLPTMFFTTEHE